MGEGSLLIHVGLARGLFEGVDLLDTDLALDQEGFHTHLRSNVHRESSQSTSMKSCLVLSDLLCNFRAMVDCLSSTSFLSYRYPILRLNHDRTISLNYQRRRLTSAQPITHSLSAVVCGLSHSERLACRYLLLS